MLWISLPEQEYFYVDEPGDVSYEDEDDSEYEYNDDDFTTNGKEESFGSVVALAGTVQGGISRTQETYVSSAVWQITFFNAYHISSADFKLFFCTTFLWLWHLQQHDTLVVDFAYE